MANEQCEIRSGKKTRNYGRNISGNHAPNESENSRNRSANKQQPDGPARDEKLDNATAPNRNAEKKREARINPEDETRKKKDKEEQLRPCEEDPYIVKLFKNLMNPDDQKNSTQKRK